MHEDCNPLEQPPRCRGLLAVFGVISCALLAGGCGSSVSGGEQTAIDPVAVQPDPPSDPGTGDPDPTPPSDPAPSDPPPPVPPPPPAPPPVTPPVTPPPTGQLPSDQLPADPPLAVAPTVFVVSADHPQASDDNDGVTLPFATLERGLRDLVPGDTLLIEGSATPYRARRGSFILANSGAPDALITIQGSGTLPVIDAGKSAADPDRPVVGLQLDCVSHVAIRFLEIRNSNDAGISTSLDGCATEDITVENTLIHHVYGTDAVGGIRLANVSGATLRANRIHDIFVEPGPAVAVAASGAATSGIVIENNDISNTAAGVTLAAGGGSVTDVAVNHNRLQNLEQGIHLQSAAQGAGWLERVDAYGNVVTDVGQVLTGDLDASTAQSREVRLYNNTYVDVSGIAYRIAGLADFENFNNLFVRASDDFLVTVEPQNAATQNSIAFSDNNLIWQGAAPAWTLQLGGPAGQRFIGLDHWRDARNQGHPELVTDPAAATVWADPQFADEANGDYRPLGTATIGTGRNGENIGAHFDGQDVGIPIP